MLSLRRRFSEDEKKDELAVRVATAAVTESSVAIALSVGWNYILYPHPPHPRPRPVEQIIKLDELVGTKVFNRGRAPALQDYFGGGPVPPALRALVLALPLTKLRKSAPVRERLLFWVAMAQKNSRLENASLLQRLAALLENRFPALPKK